MLLKNCKLLTGLLRRPCYDRGHGPDSKVNVRSTPIPSPTDPNAAYPRRRFLACTAMYLSACAMASPLHAVPVRTRLYINTAFGPPISTPAKDGFFDRLMALIFRDSGYEIVIQTPPAERALMLANLGIDDGDGPRIPKLDEAGAYANLILVEEPVLDVEFVAFTQSLRFRTEGWDSLIPYSVAFVTGWKILERNVRNTADLILVKDAEHLFHLLKHGRTEVAIIDRMSGLEATRQAGIHHFNILEPPLARSPMYLYLHRNHETLAHEITRKLRALKADGTYAQLERETLSHVLDHSAR